MLNFFANLVRVSNVCLSVFFLNLLCLLIDIALINIVCIHEISYAMNLLFNVIFVVYYRLCCCNHDFSFYGSSVEGDDVDEDGVVESIVMSLILFSFHKKVCVLIFIIVHFSKKKQWTSKNNEQYSYGSHHAKFHRHNCQS
eukprot:TRINITY_DN26868_c0_g1_i3.p1 TRINITY_DN26868_c0_g1~~TRINITY_DN26868_c0_g1_i3.p1  ORF type:complete len:141 (+),score=0.34 TRINITY_DN26868_c0_g1_i3:235-657(+)